MKKKYYAVGVAALTLMLAACGTDSEEGTTKEKTTQTTEDSKTVASESATQKITYLGESYEVPSKVETIITASLEAMEDAAVLGVKPAGVVSSGGPDIPSYLAKDLEGATVIGSKKEPSTEKMLTLNPDVILGTSKWDESQFASFNKVATTFPYSHISTNWKENLLLFGELTGKKELAEEKIASYETQVEALKTKIQASDLKDKKVLIIRVRGGLAVYPAGVYLNPSLYEEFGLTQPKELDTLEAQTDITYETLAEWNPDVILLQYAEDENTETPEILDEVLNNKVFKSTTAAKEDKVYVNVADPMAQGGTAWSKQQFIEGFEAEVLK